MCALCGDDSGRRAIPGLRRKALAWTAQEEEALKVCVFLISWSVPWVIQPLMMFFTVWCSGRGDEVLERWWKVGFSMAEDPRVRVWSF